jgi:hypothetical protein
MKLSNFTAKLTCIAKPTWIKRNAFRILSVAALAVAALAAAAPAAQAQQINFGVRIGGPYRPTPRYVASYPVVPVGFWAEGRYWANRRAYDDFCYHRNWERFHHGWR